MYQIRKNLKLVARKIKLGIMVYLEYRSSLLFYTLSSFAWAIASIVLQKFIFDEIVELKGWTFGEFALLNGVYNLSFACFIMFSWGSVYEEFRPAVKEGRLDRILTKPFAHKFFLTFGSFDMVGLFHLLPSMFIIIYASQFLTFNFPLINIILAVVYFLVGQFVLNSIVYLFYASTFWLTSAEHISSAFWTLESQSKTPLEILPRFVRAAFLSIIPIGFVAYIPTKALLGELSSIFFLYAVFFVVFLTFVNRTVWRLGVQRYESASS
ncbi:MAG: ABC-2 family transporter protein [Candidatus Dojkabacteria bacterium]|nr:ABC-2 family transporter protein [Candidatus Dojkabacteria bacterium]